MIDLAQRYKGIVFYNPAECRVLMDMRTVELIKKDLEILEILKETIKNNVFDVAMLDDRPNGETLLSCDDFGITLKTEDYYKIVGWKNDK